MDEIKERLVALARRVYLQPQNQGTADYLVEIETSDLGKCIVEVRLLKIDTLRDYRYCTQLVFEGPRALEAMEAALVALSGEDAELKKALTAWAKWYSARLDSGSDYTGYEQDLFEALGCEGVPAPDMP